MRIEKDQENDLIILLRFGPRAGRDIRLRWQTYAEIARYINRSITYIRNVCLGYTNQNRTGQERGLVAKTGRVENLFKRTSKRLISKMKKEPPKWRRSQLQ